MSDENDADDGRPKRERERAEGLAEFVQTPELDDGEVDEQWRALNARMERYRSVESSVELQKLPSQAAEPIAQVVRRRPS